MDIGWILASLLIFASLQRSEAITFSTQPENPYVVVVGVNNTGIDLIWEFVIESGETVYSVQFQRSKPGDITPVTLASRRANTAFTVFDPYREDYAASLNSRLRLNKVSSDQKYIYTIVINFSKNNVPRPSIQDEVNVVVKVPPKLTVVPERQPIVEVGKNFTLTCNASGDPHPQILWTKEGVAAKDYNVSGYKLHLVELKRTDVGSYKCTANNGYGIATSVSVVSVKCPTNGCQIKTIGITITDEKNWPWKQAYNNRDSIEYKMLQSNLTSAIATVYTKNSNKQLYEQAITELRSGSIVAHVQLLFGSGVNDPLQPLRDEVATGNLGPFKVNTQLVVDPLFPPMTTISVFPPRTTISVFPPRTTISAIPPSTTISQETTTGTKAPPNNTGADTNSGTSTAEAAGIVIGVLLVIMQI